MIELSPDQRRELRARAHHLQPVVSIAEKGLSEGVLKEAEIALRAHELIKIRVYGDDRAVREAIYAELCAKLDCAPVQHIGKLLVLYRPGAEKPKVAAPKKALNKGTPPKRAARPATAAPPRIKLKGLEGKSRQRKATAGSTRARKGTR